MMDKKPEVVPEAQLQQICADSKKDKYPMATNKKVVQSRAELVGTLPKMVESESRKLARLTMKPSVQAAITCSQFGKNEIDINDYVTELSSQVQAVNSGNLSRAEAILVSQAHTLDALFNRLVCRAIGQDQIKFYEPYMRLALKAQSNCRATIEALAAIKNPPVIYARQANIANGPQQVNNGIPPPARTEKQVNQRNELLEVQHGSETMDSRTAGASIRIDPAMAALGEGNRG